VTARHLTTVLPGQPPVRRAVLTTATPGLYLARVREACDHDEERYDPRRCPGHCGRQCWYVLTASGLGIHPHAWTPGDRTIGEARALATELGAAGIDWTAPDVVTLLDQLTPVRVAALLPVLRARRVPVPRNRADAAEALARTRARYAASTGEGGR
jgi:hypothetical protein